MVAHLAPGTWHLAPGPGGGPHCGGDLGGLLHHPRLRGARGVCPHPQDDPGIPSVRIGLQHHLSTADYFAISVQNIKRNEVRERKREQKEMQRQMEVIV